MEDTSITNETVTNTTIVREAYDAGRAWAKGLKPGMRFMGASPEAIGRFPENTRTAKLLRAIFRHSALDVMEHKRLCTDGDGIITSYTDK